MSKVGPFVLGGLVGVAIGILYAPRTGDQTRALVSEKINAVWGEARDFGASAKQDPQAAYSRLQERSASVFQDAAAKGTEFAQQAGTSATQAFDAARSRVKDATGQVEPAFSGEGDGDELRAKIEAARARIAAQVMQNAQESSVQAPVDAPAEESAEVAVADRAAAEE